MTERSSFDVGSSTDLVNFCSTCMRRSKNFYELKPRGSSLVERLFTYFHKSKRIFHVCTVCKLTIDFISQFERLCETSCLAAENWDVIEIKSECFQEDAKVQNALGVLCQWVTENLDENMQMCKLDERDYNSIDVIAAVNDRQGSVEREFDDEKLVKSEELLEEYLVESDYDVEMEDGEHPEEIVLEIKPPPKRSRKKEAPGSKFFLLRKLRNQIFILLLF